MQPEGRHPHASIQTRGVCNSVITAGEGIALLRLSLGGRAAVLAAPLRQCTPEREAAHIPGQIRNRASWDHQVLQHWHTTVETTALQLLTLS